MKLSSQEEGSEMALKPKAGDSGAGTIHLSVVEGVLPSCLPVPQVPTSTSAGEEMFFWDS